MSVRIPSFTPLDIALLCFQKWSIRSKTYRTWVFLFYASERCITITYYLYELKRVLHFLHLSCREASKTRNKIWPVF
jgi:hypothetical protein